VLGGFCAQASFIRNSTEDASAGMRIVAPSIGV
jgi:hypothetical protein